MIQNTLFCKRARAAAGGRKQALVWEGYAARLLCHYITLRGGAQARQRQRKTLWGHGRARKGAGGEGCARADLPPQGNAARPWRQGERRQATRKRAGARRGARPRAPGRTARREHCRLGGQPPRTAGKRRTQQCAGAAALLCRHAGARAPTADDVPTTEGGAHRRP